MKIISLITLYVLLTTNSKCQSIYKGLTYGMSKTEANKEFKNNKSTYTNIDLGNNFLYRIYKQNFVFDKNKLVGILLSPKGSAMGQTYDSAKKHLIHTRRFFEKLEYETFLDNQWWNAPINYVKSSSKWGLVLNKKDKSTIIQLYPISFEISGNKSFLVKLMIWNYNAWMGYYNKEKTNQINKINNSGF